MQPETRDHNETLLHFKGPHVKKGNADLEVSVQPNAARFEHASPSSGADRVTHGEDRAFGKLLVWTDIVWNVREPPR